MYFCSLTAFFLSSSSSSRISLSLSLSLSPVFQTVCMREHGRTEELGEPGVHACICMWGGFTCMVMISIGNWASSFTPKQ